MHGLSPDQIRSICDEHDEIISRFAVPPEVLNLSAFRMEQAITNNPGAYAVLLSQLRQEREDGQLMLDFPETDLVPAG